MWFCLLQVVALSEIIMSVYWNSKDMRVWMDSTQEKQQEYFDCSNIRERICNLANLTVNIEFYFDLLEKEKLELFKYKPYRNKSKIFHKIKHYINKYQDKNDIYFSVLFVHVKGKDYDKKLPIIKLQLCSKYIQKEKHIFIDLSCRVSKNWQYTLNNITLPNCILCYPKNGFYSAVNGVVELEYKFSLGGKRRKLFKCFDIVCAVLGTAAAVVGTAAFCFPVAMPVAAG